MIHQRNVLAVYYIAAAIGAYIFSMLIGTLLGSLLIVAVISLPITFVIKKILPAPDWYANEDEKSKMTSLNLSATSGKEDK
jgi:hypothetical protein